MLGILKLNFVVTHHFLKYYICLFKLCILLLLTLSFDLTKTHFKFQIYGKNLYNLCKKPKIDSKSSRVCDFKLQNLASI